MTATWTRAELKAQGGWTDQDIDCMIAETATFAADLGRVNPLRTVGEGEDQLIQVDPAFAKVIGWLC